MYVLEKSKLLLNNKKYKVISKSISVFSTCLKTIECPNTVCEGDILMSCVPATISEFERFEMTSHEQLLKYSCSH